MTPNSDLTMVLVQMILILCIPLQLCMIGVAIVTIEYLWKRMDRGATAVVETKTG